MDVVGFGSGGEDRSPAGGNGDAPIRTLLADDTAALRSLIKMILEGTGRFEVVAEVPNGAAAVKKARELQPDLVLLDVSMPIQDGMEALPIIVEVAPSAQVIMLSGFEAQRLKSTAMKLGAAGYLEKGMHPTDFIDELMRILSVSPIVAASGNGQNGDGSASDAAITDMSAEELMTCVAHELRSPLSLIQSYGTSALAGWDSMSDPEHKDAVARMTESTRFLESVVNNMLSLRALEMGTLSMHVTTEAAESVVRSVARNLAYLSSEHPLQLELEGGLPSIRVDAARLQQVLTNLVVNAAKFAPSGTPIAIRARTKDRHLLLQVVDQGPGIPPLMREKVFEKFARGSATGPGVGLGLFISRQLMSSMGGEIWIEDAPEGTVVTCRLATVEWGVQKVEAV